MKRGIVLGLLIVGGSLTAAAFQQPAPAPRVIEVDKIKDNLYVMKGGGGNSSVFVTGNGVVVVDTKLNGWGQPLLDKIKTLTDKPVTMIISTHTHGDHVGGNVEFPATVDIVAHENSKTNMTTMRPSAFARQPAGGPAPNIFAENNGKGMPKKTFKDRMTIGSGNDRIELHYFGPAHTDGDAMVLFPAQRVFHMADVFPAKQLPGMDSNNGASAVRYVDTLTKAADFADKNNVEFIVNGHNDKTTTRAELREYIEYVRDFVAFVQEAKKSGRTVDQVVASGWKAPEKYKGYEGPSPLPLEVRVRVNTALIYNETK